MLRMNAAWGGLPSWLPLIHCSLASSCPAKLLSSNGVIDRSELRGLLQMVDGGDEIVPVVGGSNGWWAMGGG